jgi:hypothetical protein
MKKQYFNLIIILLLVAFVAACSKDSEDVSRETAYPVLKIKGDQFMTIAKGSTFTDPGIDATIGGSPVQYQTEGTVNAATPGVYKLTYSAVNSDGYSAVVKRWVGVYESNIIGKDYSGVWKRTTGVITNWTKDANNQGLYVTDNVGGVNLATSPAFGFDIRIFNIKDSTLVIPLQPATIGGELTCTSINLKPSVGNGQVSWVVIHPNYGTAARTFNRQ